MQRIMFLLILLVALAATATAGSIDPAFETILADKGSDDLVSAIVYMDEQADIVELDARLKSDAASMKERHARVIDELQFAAGSQSDLTAYLDTEIGKGSVAGYTSYWITNAMVVYATKEQIIKIAERDDVELIGINFDPELIEPTVGEAPPMNLGDRDVVIENNIYSTRASEVWDVLGYTGEGTIVAGLDTGVLGTHYYLDEKWRGYNNAHPASECWLDLLDDPSTFPEDCNTDYGHGTVTMGLMVGHSGDRYIGMAPDAQWIACQGIRSTGCPSYQSTLTNSVLGAYQWFMDPDGNPATVDDVPDVVNNSFGLTYPDCDVSWITAILNAEAAGIMTVWGAGNEGYNHGPVASSLRSPADVAVSNTSIFSVGAVKTWIDEWNDGIFPHPIWIDWSDEVGGSSRGPSTCSWASGQLEIKPEVVAPGHGMISSMGSGSLGWAGSGTSLASPHVAGLVALMREANPDAPVDAMKQIIFDTARDEESPVGEDNTYGNGFIDAYEAVLEVLPPAAPALVSPLDTQHILGPANVTLDWAWVADAVGYQLQVATDAGFTNILYNYPVIGTERTLPTVAEGRYYWRVRGIDEYNLFGDWSVTRSFVYRIIISCPVLYSFDGGEYRRENPLLTACEASNYTENVADYYLVEDLADAGELRFQLRETEDEITLLQGIELLTVDTEADAKVICSTDGRVISYTEAFAPAEAVDQNGRDILSAVADKDGHLFSADGPGQVEVHFRDLPPHIVNVGVGVSSDRKPPCPHEHLNDPPFERASDSNLTVETLNADGEWISLTAPPTRATPVQEHLLVDVIDGEAALRLSWTEGYATDRIVAYVPTEADPLVTAWPVAANIIRTADRSQDWSLVDADNPLELRKGDVFEFTFEPDAVSGDRSRHYIIKAQGRYQPDFSVFTDATPGKAHLHGNYPNPFNPTTKISYDLPSAGHVKLEIYSESGRLIDTLVNGAMTAGNHSVVWDGTDRNGHKVSSGIYFYRLTAGETRIARKMIMIK